MSSCFSLGSVVNAIIPPAWHMASIINTPGIPETLFESELFGHARGAFTDAFTEKKGLVEAAAGGTLFIDEITEVSMAMQAKLLRFIETSRFTPLGEVEEKEVDVRIVAATNKNLQRAIKKKEFREDLYYRLNVFELEIPCLRDRKEDIRPLVEQEIRYLQEKTIGEGFWGAMLEYDWPGNVRQLISVLKRMGFYHKDEIGDADVRNILNNTAAAGTVDVSENESGAGRLWSILREGGNFWEVVKKPFLARDLNRAEVKSLIALGLEQTGGKYKKLLKIFNMDNDDYHRFMRFIHEQDLKP
ncbi:MAG: sigma-54-dependent Fis family transcriptional regulator [bacterium]|nr:sigma-54-dependent Fis family transcriptional regulator [bacterium]